MDTLVGAIWASQQTPKRHSAQRGLAEQRYRIRDRPAESMIGYGLLLGTHIHVVLAERTWRALSRVTLLVPWLQKRCQPHDGCAGRSGQSDDLDGAFLR
jgi:hypothetical protein